MAGEYTLAREAMTAFVASGQKQGMLREMAHGAIVATIAQLICSGVAERHPRLKFVCCEFETGWLAHVLQRLDHATYRARQEASPDLTMPPSAYFRRQFYATFEDDQLGVMTRHAIGVDNLM
ncbi:MAG: hypothetical protein HYZ50_03290 [Deltaproteobacteria bacterium]|nr:hypothetical protein [Deltaproteobacteria bacterium]